MAPGTTRTRCACILQLRAAHEAGAVAGFASYTLQLSRTERELNDRQRCRRAVRVELEVRLHDALNTFQSEQHIEIARAFLAKGDQGLVFG